MQTTSEKTKRFGEVGGHLPSEPVELQRLIFISVTKQDNDKR